MERRIKHLKRSQSAELFGWVGACCVLGGYALSSFGIALSDSLVYNLLFLIGSAGLAVITYRHRAYQSFIVNSTFVVLALIAIVRIAYFS